VQLSAAAAAVASAASAAAPAAVAVAALAVAAAAAAAVAVAAAAAAHAAAAHATPLVHQRRLWRVFCTVRSEFRSLFHDGESKSERTGRFKDTTTDV
jgi:hypothetical protein